MALDRDFARTAKAGSLRATNHTRAVFRLVRPSCPDWPSRRVDADRPSSALPDLTESVPALSVHFIYPDPSFVLLAKPVMCRLAILVAASYCGTETRNESPEFKCT